MSYIVDPSWVYWVSVLEGLGILFCIIGGVALIALLIIGPITVFDAYDPQEHWQKHKKTYILWGCVGLFILLLGILTPSRETLIKMKIAELATKENIQLTAEQLKEIVDYIINALKELK